MNLINEITSRLNYHYRFLFKSSEIILKINEIGKNNIIYSGWLNKEYQCPSEIYLNDVIQSLTDCTKININKPGSTVKLVWNNPLNSTRCLFCYCSNITEIKFTHFDTSLLSNIAGLFQDCYSLTLIDFSNLNTKNITLIRNMFINCTSIKFINLSNFDLSNTEAINAMFKNCLSLTSINLSNFDTSKVTIMSNLFYNCKNLEYINLLNFNDIKSPSTSNMFYGISKNAVICIDKNKASSIYNIAKNMSCVVISCRADWRNVQKKINKKTGECLDTCPYNTTPFNNICYSNDELCDSNCKTCYLNDNIPSSNCSSCYENKFLKNGKCVDTCEDGYKYYDSINNINYCTSDYSCPKSFDKLIPIKQQCIDECQKDSNYKYEFNHTCYQECPNNISVKSESKDFYCEVKCSFEFPYELIETQNCVKACTIAQRESGKCKINFISKEENNKEIEEKVVENIKEELTNNFDTSEVDKGKNILIEQKDSTITITTTENQKNEKSPNLTTIHLGECETKLKDEYHIPENKSLYLLKIDVKQEGLKIPKIVYEVYYPLFGDNLIKLNLTACKDSKIEFSIPYILNNDIDKIDPSSEYYNDICYTYTSEDGTDITLLDRKNNFVNNNLTVCEEDCNFNGYNYTLGKANCSCNAQINPINKIGDIVFDKNKLFNSFTNFKNLLNINVLKCYKSIFNLDECKKNYANFILISIIIFFIATFIIFYCKDYYNLKKLINIIVYFQLNLNLVKQFQGRIKRMEQKNLKNRKKLKYLKKENKRKTKINNKKGKINLKLIKKNKINSVKSGKIDIFSEYKNILANPLKKGKRIGLVSNNINKFNNIIISKNVNINKNHEAKNKKNIVINKKDYPYNMKYNQMFEIFLKINNNSDYELNELSYESAVKIDKRTFFQYYLSLLRIKHLLFFSFYPSFDYNSQILKIFLFFFDFALSFMVNALFFNDDTMHKIYEDKGTFNIIYNIPQIFFLLLYQDLLIAL